MMSYAQIDQQTRLATRKSREAGIGPLVIESYNLLGRDDEALAFKLRRIPFLGDRTPRGWTKVAELFVDASGFGSDSEPAMTFGRFMDRVREYGAGYGYSIAEAGQFQVVIRVMRPSKGVA